MRLDISMRDFIKRYRCLLVSMTVLLFIIPTYVQFMGIPQTLPYRGYGVLSMLYGIAFAYGFAELFNGGDGLDE
jgi:hypothetical protein